MKREGALNLGWYLRYALLPRSDAWYGSLFRPGQAQLSGEISPEYACLGDETVRRIRALMPNLRVIYLLRDPVERAWSQAAKYFSARREGGLDKAPRAEVEAFLKRPGTLRHSSYSSNLGVWEGLFAKNQIFVGFYDQLVEDPRGLLVAIYRFLGVDDSDPHLPETLRAKHNARSYTGIDRQFAAQLASALEGEVERLHDRFDNRYTEAWLWRAREALS